MKIHFYGIGFIMIFLGILLFFDIKLIGKINVYPTTKNIIIYILLGLICLIIGYYLKKEKHTICPKCKESFHYNELKDGKCKYCEDIDTIDTNKYYKKHSEEI